MDLEVHGKKLQNVLSYAVHSRGCMILNVSSSGIATLLFSGGRTAHSRSNVLIKPDEFSTCKIQLESDHTELISIAPLTICDITPIMRKY